MTRTTNDFSERPMPLRDHFHPPLFPFFQWESFHGQWAGMIVQDLNTRVLPPGYIAAPFVSLQGGIEVDVGAIEGDNFDSREGAGVAVLPYAPPQAQVSVDVDFTGL